MKSISLPMGFNVACEQAHVGAQASAAYARARKRAAKTPSRRITLLHAGRARDSRVSLLSCNLGSPVLGLSLWSLALAKNFLPRAMTK